MRTTGAILLRKIGGRLEALTRTRQLIGTPMRAPSIFATLSAFCLALLVPLLTLVALFLFVTHPPAAVAAPFLLVPGTTTGTKSSGTDFVGLNDMLKQVYTKAFENNVEADSEVADLFTKAEGFDVVDGPDGKQINMGHILSSGGGVGSMGEDDYLYTPTPPNTKQSAITIKQHIAVVELSGRTLRRVKKGAAAFVTWATEALPRKAQRLAFHKDRMYLGTGTGIVCRINGTPDGTGDGIDNMFGISGLDDRAAMLLLRDDPIRIGPNANGTSLRTNNLVVSLVDYVNKAINTTINYGGSAGTGASGADNDYVFLGDGNIQGSGSREMMGLEGIVDDGTNVATFQTLTRSSYPEALYAQIIDSTAAQWDTTLSEEILDYADALAFERGNMGKPTSVLVNRSGQRSFWKNLKNDRIINDPRGTMQGGVNRARLKMQLGDRIVTLAAGRKVPASRAYGIDGSAIQRYRIGDGRWDDTDGSVWNRVVDSTGRKDAFFAVYVEEEELGAGNPAGCFKITGLAET